MSKASSTQRGYDEVHKRNRTRLIYNMTEGEPCWWCSKPMHKNRTDNWDRMPLAADHEQRHGAKQRQLATRLLHHTCNSQRQDGRNDTQRPALQPAPTTPTGTLAKPFTWA